MLPPAPHSGQVFAIVRHWDMCSWNLQMGLLQLRGDFRKQRDLPQSTGPHCPLRQWIQQPDTPRPRLWATLPFEEDLRIFHLSVRWHISICKGIWTRVHEMRRSKGRGIWTPRRFPRRGEASCTYSKTQAPMSCTRRKAQERQQKILREQGESPLCVSAPDASHLATCLLYHETASRAI